MSNARFVLSSLLLCCLSISGVYSLLSPGDRVQVAGEMFRSFLYTAGGILALAAGIVTIPWIFGAGAW